MQKPTIYIYNTLTRKHEAFIPISSNNVNIYVCGPTVYGPAHLGHARSAITFDLVFRTFKYLNYRTTYVRNITDVGHLTNDTAEGEDKVGHIARLRKVHPMQVAHQYTTSYHNDMRMLKVLPPSIEPQATGHMIEQIACIRSLLKKGYAYEVNGSVYFDLNKYYKKYNYGILSGRKIEDLLSGTRVLHQQKEKKNSLDFALWKKAAPNHLMQWPSPWSQGFPGWHLECSAMSSKYLGTKFDIHGGGLDLAFPHHECEIAQHTAVYDTQPASYWIHNNLVTIDNEKMSKSAGNFVTLAQCFTGLHPLLTQSYAPLVLRFFILQAHYRSTLSFSNQALQAAEKGYYKLLNTYNILQRIPPIDSHVDSIDSQVSKHIQDITQSCYTAFYYDFNSAKVIALLFKLSKYINAINNHTLSITQVDQEVWKAMKKMYTTFMQDILALDKAPDVDAVKLIKHLLVLYKEAKDNKSYQQVDRLRSMLREQGILIEDGKYAVQWRYT